MKTALTIAGSDCSGGAGIQADIKTMTVNGVYAMSAITALTAQNTCGVTDIMEVSPAFLKAQLEAIWTDIPPDAVKIGMVASVPLIETIAESLTIHPASAVVVDPVMVATSGARLIAEDAIESLKARLFPLATLLTPNIPEAEILTGRTIQSATEMEEAAQQIGETYHCAVLVKGGHNCHDANDYLWSPQESRWFHGTRIDNPNTHGTGCTLSSAIAANLAVGHDLIHAISHAKDYLTRALAAQLNLGHGAGPLNHMVRRPCGCGFV